MEFFGFFVRARFTSLINRNWNSCEIFTESKVSSVDNCVATSVSGQQSAWSLPPTREKNVNREKKWIASKLNAQYWFLVVNASEMKAEEIRAEENFPNKKNERERGKQREKKEKFRKAKARSGHIKIYEWRRRNSVFIEETFFVGPQIRFVIIIYRSIVDYEWIEIGSKMEKRQTKKLLLFSVVKE